MPGKAPSRKHQQLSQRAKSKPAWLFKKLTRLDRQQRKSWRGR